MKEIYLNQIIHDVKRYLFSCNFSFDVVSSLHILCSSA